MIEDLGFKIEVDDQTAAEKISPVSFSVIRTPPPTALNTTWSPRIPATLLNGLFEQPERFSPVVADVESVT